MLMIFGKKYYQKTVSFWVTNKIIFGKWESKDPCGPCSEIHVDMRTTEEKKAVSGASLVNMDHPQVVGGLESGFH